ncbi:MAG TPA: hypothetical protein VN654_17075 [Vicinamibacterales bacterium]|jgi:hypothetical protein|nr:hypothetical protein [Vicinamibacterales bacterium]
MARTGLLLAALLAFGAAVSAFEQALDPGSLAQAIELGQSRIDDMRSRFHAPYRTAVTQPPVDYIDVVTPFRRIALDAEAQARAGGRLYGQREALAALGDNPARVDVVVDLTFHPLNNYIGVPEFTVTLLAPGGARIEPSAISRAPRFGPRLSTSLPYPYLTGGAGPQNGTSLAGGLVVAGFDGRALDPNGTYVVLIREGAKDVTRATVNFERLR